MQRLTAVFFETLFGQNRHRHLGTIARRDHHAFGHILRRIISAGDFLHLQCFQAAIGQMIIKHRVGRDHRFITQPQLRHIIFGIIAKAGIIAGLREFDWLHLAGIGIIADFNLIEAINPAFGHIEVFEQRQPRQIVTVRPGDERFPIAWRLHAGGGDAEIDVIVIGQNIQRTIAHIDAILASRLARGHHDRRGSRVACRNQPNFARHIVARTNDDPIFLRGQADTNAKTDILFFIQQLRFGQIFTQPVIPRIVGAPVFIGEAIDNAFAVR